MALTAVRVPYAACTSGCKRQAQLSIRDSAGILWGSRSQLSAEVELLFRPASPFTAFNSNKFK
jgi:hypothetical protein